MLSGREINRKVSNRYRVANCQGDVKAFSRLYQILVKSNCKSPGEFGPTPCPGV
jgi:hypothetical protein